MESLHSRLAQTQQLAERTRKRQSKFTNSFYRFKFNLFVLGAGRRAHSKKLMVARSGFSLGKRRRNQLLAGYPDCNY